MSDTAAALLDCKVWITGGGGGESYSSVKTQTNPFSKAS